MNIWKRFASNEVTHSVAHYLTAMHRLHRERGYARVSDLAKELEVTKGSVSVQVKHLKEKGLVVEDENRFLRLTESGGAIAREVIHNRQLLIRFLIEVLGVKEDLAEIDACKIEHLLSKETCDQLLAMVHLLHSEKPAAKKFRELVKSRRGVES